MPELILDKNTCLRNIEKMASKATRHRLGFRPHFKTHQSAEIGRWFADFGVSKITVSSLRMAAYFAAAGWRDILVAFPFNPGDTGLLEAMPSGVNVSLLLDHPAALGSLDSLGRNVDFYIDVDTGYGRTGMETANVDGMASLIESSGKNSRISFRGFYCHAGHSYHTRDRDLQNAIHRKARKDLSILKEEFAALEPRILYGDTPGCSIQDDFTGIDEITPGNFVFYDLTQHALGACQMEDIAVSLRCPVTGVYPRRDQLLIRGGAIHLSKESLDLNGRKVYGQVKDTGCYLESLSQEHGILRPCRDLLQQTSIGDTLDILPVHSCLAANLMKAYVTKEGLRVETLNS